LECSIRARLTEELPQSSFRLDLPALRAEIEAYDSVAEASLRLGAGGEMIATIRERAPVVVWHSGTERQLLDLDGHRVAILAPNAQVPALPLIAGDGAQAHVREALALLDAAQPLGERLRGLVRVGERRWDVVLDRDQRIRLPEQGAMQALERALALDDAQDLLARDVLSVDLRNPTRPVLHVSQGAIETMRAIRLNPSEVSQ
jgi:cell division septal protein FtsQ